MRTDYNSKKQGDQSDLAGHLVFCKEFYLFFADFQTAFQCNTTCKISDNINTGSTHIAQSIDADIIVSGIDKIKVNLANCCNPVYGDEIVGYITKGNGISVHLMHCHNLSMLENRTVDVKWNTNVKKRYLTSLLVYSNDSDNHMLDLVQIISMMNVSVDGIKTMNKGGNSVYEVNCYVTGIEQLNKLIANINKNSYIEKVEREMR